MVDVFDKIEFGLVVIEIHAKIRILFELLKSLWRLTPAFAVFSNNAGILLLVEALVLDVIVEALAVSFLL